MTTIVDGLKVVWDKQNRSYLCQGHGHSFLAWFAGTPSSVETEIFKDSNSRLECIGTLDMPAPNWPFEAPTETEVATEFSRQLRLLIADSDHLSK
jgi:hypothetical protein